MGPIFLYRGNLHSPADIPRRWPMPQRALSLSQFRYLLRKRNVAISRFPTGNPSLENGNPDDVSGTICPKEVPNLATHSEGGGSDVPSQLKDKVKAEGLEVLNDCRTAVVVTEDRPIVAGADSMEVVGMEAGCGGDDCAKEQVVLELNATDDNEVRKRDLEKKLDVLNAKKHYLVQMLKQILNAEEEIKRRNFQSAATRSYVPHLQPETSNQTSSGARYHPNFAGDAGGEPAAATTANNTVQARQWPPMPATSPSTSIGKSPHTPFHNNTARTPRGNIQSSSSMMSSLTAIPSYFIPITVSISGTHVAATSSSLSPALSGGTSSPFRDFRMK